MQEADEKEKTEQYPGVGTRRKEYLQNLLLIPVVT